MAETYFSSSLSATQIENVLSGVHGVTGIVKRNSDDTFSAADVYPVLTGSSAPTTSTEGYLNQLYRCGTSLYVCTAASGTSYTWTLVSSGSGTGVMTATCTLAYSGWSSTYTQSVTVAGVTSSNIVAISPAPEFTVAFDAAKVVLTGQSTNTLSFTCTTLPTSDLTINVLILE